MQETKQKEIRERVHHTAKLVPQSQRELFIDEIATIISTLLSEDRAKIHKDIQKILLNNVITIQDFGQYFKRGVFDEIEKLLNNRE